MSDDTKTTTIARQKKWDQAFGEDMTSEDVDALLKLEPFKSIAEEKLSRAKEGGDKDPLKGIKDILLHETRIVDYQPNEIVVRQGDYGGSAFLVISGQVLPLYDVEV